MSNGVSTIPYDLTVTGAPWKHVYKTANYSRFANTPFCYEATYASGTTVIFFTRLELESGQTVSVRAQKTETPDGRSALIDAEQPLLLGAARIEDADFYVSEPGDIGRRLIKGKLGWGRVPKRFSDLFNGCVLNLDTTTPDIRIKTMMPYQTQAKLTLAFDTLRIVGFRGGEVIAVDPRTLCQIPGVPEHRQHIDSVTFNRPSPCDTCSCIGKPMVRP